MAENKISFNRFTALPNNIATYGSTPEELKLQAGTPDPNPSVSPMPSATPADVHLALGRLGSDQLRFQEPVTPAPNAFENNRLNLSVSGQPPNASRAQFLNKCLTSSAAVS